MEMDVYSKKKVKAALDCLGHVTSIGEEDVKLLEDAILSIRSRMEAKEAKEAKEQKDGDNQNK